MLIKLLDNSQAITAKQELPEQMHLKQRQEIVFFKTCLVFSSPDLSDDTVMKLAKIMDFVFWFWKQLTKELNFKKTSQNETLNGIKTATQQMCDFYKFCNFLKTIPVLCLFQPQEKFIFHLPVDQCNKIS